VKVGYGYLGLREDTHTGAINLEVIKVKRYFKVLDRIILGKVYIEKRMC
jgi:hypothetical protein